MTRTPAIRTWGLLLALFCVTGARAEEAPKKPEAPAEHPQPLKPPPDSVTQGSVSVKQQRIDYQAIAGTLVVPLHDAAELEGEKDPRDEAQTAMFYTAYLATGQAAERRPLVFLYNGGPGSSSVWLHLGSFGPWRARVPGDQHLPAAPYALVPNAWSLLDVADLVFIDAPGTGFSRTAGKDREKAFYGIDGDAEAFARFVDKFLTRQGRWNSPKYLFGESYGTTRSAVVARLLQERGIDLNGVILLSQILDFATGVGGGAIDPGNELPYVLSLPSYAAVAWYHKLVPDAPAALEPWLAEAERFASGEYAQALALGSALPQEQRHKVAERLHRFTSLPVAYLERADLRVTGEEFEQTLQLDRGLTTGRLDSRFAGPAIDLLDKEAAYDPFSSAIGASFTALFNDYARKTLKFGESEAFLATRELWKTWDFRHRAPNEPIAFVANVMPDLAQAMKHDPGLKVLNLAGYYDLATPYAAARYELAHLQLPDALRANIRSLAYPSGHMIYVNEAVLPQLHDDVAGFIRETASRR